MQYLSSRLYTGVFNFFLLFWFVLIYSCQSDPILYNIKNGYNYELQSFQTDPDSITSIQSEHSIGKSPRLYVGIIDSSDTAYAVIRFSKTELIDTHQVCSDSSNINYVSITINAIKQLIDTDTLIQSNALKIYSLSDNSEWDEDNKAISKELVTQLLSNKDQLLSYEISNSSLIIDEGL